MLTTQDINRLKGIFTTKEEFTNLVKKVDGLSGTVDNLSIRFDDLSARFDGLSTRFDGLSTRFDDLSTRVDGLPDKFLTQDDFAEFTHDLFDKLDKIYGEVKIAGEERNMHAQTHDDINNQFDEIRSLPTVSLELKQKSPKKLKN